MAPSLPAADRPQESTHLVSRQQQAGSRAAARTASEDVRQLLPVSSGGQTPLPLRSLRGPSVYVALRAALRDLQQVAVREPAPGAAAGTSSQTPNRAVNFQ